jgi:hypothetical protein
MGGGEVYISMGIVERSNVIQGAIGQFAGSGAPTAGTDEVQTITIGGTPTGGTFTLTLEGQTTAPITWSATNATLLANVDAALEALPNVGTGGVVTAAGTLTAGIGTITCTFSGGNRARQPLGGTMVAASSLTGTSPTVAVARTTPGVAASPNQVGLGSTYTDSATGVVYSNTGNQISPTWTKVGLQS